MPMPGSMASSVVSTVGSTEDTMPAAVLDSQPDSLVGSVVSVWATKGRMTKPTTIIKASTLFDTYITVSFHVNIQLTVNIH